MAKHKITVSATFSDGSVVTRKTTMLNLAYGYQVKNEEFHQHFAGFASSELLAQKAARALMGPTGCSFEVVKADVTEAL